MNAISIRKLTAPCGLDCFNCEAHESNVTEEMRKVLSGAFDLAFADAHCKGCREQKGEKLGFPMCETYKCAKKKGAVFCHECDEFPCQKLQPVKDGADRFPHNMKLYNLCRMKAVGLEEWAKEAPDIRKRYYFGKFVIGKGPVIDEHDEVLKGG
jgi:hypothetical protein